MAKVGYCCVLVLGLWLALPFYVREASARAVSEGQMPLLSRTQHPLYLQFLTMIPSSARALEKGVTRVGLQTVHSNLLERKLNNPGVGIDLDMEIWRSAVLVEYGLGKGFELALEIPFLSTSAGFLDAFIQDYHATFGFPNGGRENVPNGRFSYAVSQNGAALYTVSSQGFAASDWTLAAKVPVYSLENGLAIAFQPLFKLPVGAPSRGTGSGNVDAGFSWIVEKAWAWFQMNHQLGFIIVGDHDFLEPLLRSHRIEWRHSFGFRLAPTLKLLVQIQGSTPLIKDVDNSTLDDPPLDLVIGFSGTGFASDRGRLFWQVAFGEDLLTTGASVDFSSHARVGYEFW